MTKQKTDDHEVNSCSGLGKSFIAANRGKSQEYSKGYILN